MEKVANAFNTLIKTAIAPTFKLKTMGTKSTFPKNPWYTEQCKAARKYLREVRSKTDLTIPEQWENFKQAESEYKRVVQCQKRKYKEKQRLELENLCSKNPDKYWEFWRKMRPHKPNLDINLQEFHEYFKNQVTPPNMDYFETEMLRDAQVLNKLPEPHNNIDDCINDIINCPITFEEIALQLRKLKNNKAAGSDGIPAEFIKYAGEEILKPLSALFNYTLANGQYPQSWTDGIINPIHKSGETSKPDNYRKITIMPSIGKLLEGILNRRLCYKNEVHQSTQVDDLQKGFKERSQTMDNIFILQTLIEKQKTEKKPLYLCFVDFTKAFDYIHRLLLFKKLNQRGIKGEFLSLIVDMFCKARCRVRWNGTLGEYINSEFGVLQGGMISPKLFTEFLQDIQHYPINVNEITVPFKIDTGAQVNLLPMGDYANMRNLPRLRKNEVQLRAYNGTTVENKGAFIAKLNYQGKVLNAQFVVVDNDMQPVIGLKTCEKLGFIKRVCEVGTPILGKNIAKEVLDRYGDVFKGIGCLPVKHKVHLKEGAIPTIDPVRRVAVAIRSDLRKELEKMEKLDVIKKIGEPTEWVSSSVVVRKKSGALRVCLDPRNLNENIMREHHPIPIKAELTSEMANAKYFSKLDAKMAFWQIELDDESQKLCTFNTPFGRYCYKRIT